MSELTVGRIAFSPGPWKADTRTVVMAGAPMKCLATAAMDLRWMKDGEAEANANLIAAAPELLAALKAIVDYCERQPEVLDCSDCSEHIKPFVEQARGVIAKAEGR